MDAEGRGSFVIPADQYPHGPVTVRISGELGAVKDNCYLQLYNQGGVSWNVGMPEDPPPPAHGMSLVFADDFNGPLSISSTDPKATYYDHKPPGGWQDFSTLRFTSFDQPNNPFRQVDSYLRIRASEKANSSGLISSMKNDASGITAQAPCYFECRFIGPNAIGTWPASKDIRENFVAALPEEYGENALIAMAVDPNTIFVDWEIVPGEIAGKEGDLTLRFHDITGIEFDGSNANAVIDIKIPQKVGNGFFVINMPGRDVIVEAGIVRPEGRFLTVMRSEVVSFPFLLTFDDLGIVQKLIISGIPLGY